MARDNQNAQGPSSSNPIAGGAVGQTPPAAGTAPNVTPAGQTSSDTQAGSGPATAAAPPLLGSEKLPAPPSSEGATPIPQTRSTDTAVPSAGLPTLGTQSAAVSAQSA